MAQVGKVEKSNTTLASEEQPPKQGCMNGRACTLIKDEGESAMRVADSTIGIARYAPQTFRFSTPQIKLTGFATSPVALADTVKMGIAVKDLVVAKDSAARKDALVDLTSSTADATGNASTVLFAAGEITGSVSDVAVRVALAGTWLMGISAALYGILIPIVGYKIWQDRKNQEKLPTMTDVKEVTKVASVNEKWQETNDVIANVWKSESQKVNVEQTAVKTESKNDETDAPKTDGAAKTESRKDKLIGFLKGRIQQKIHSKALGILAMVIVIVAIAIFLAAISNPIGLGIAYGCLTIACLISLGDYIASKVRDRQFKANISQLAAA